MGKLAEKTNGRKGKNNAINTGHYLVDLNLGIAKTVV